MLVSPETATLTQRYVNYIRDNPKSVIVVSNVITKCYKDFMKIDVTDPTRGFGMTRSGRHTSYYVSHFGFNNGPHVCPVSVYNVLMSYSRYLFFRVNTWKPYFKKCYREASGQWFIHNTFLISIM